MTCAPYVVPASAVLRCDDSVAKAASLVAASCFAPLPVLSAEGRVVGLFGPRELARLLLPTGARLAGGNFALGFLSEEPEALRERLASVAGDDVARHMAPHTPIRAETSLHEALRRMHHGATHQSVVDDQGRLVGMLTAASVLTTLVEER